MSDAICRCCLSQGCYKDIATEYYFNGKKEVYADMLKETFNLTIYSNTDTLNRKRFICNTCISRLRDASDFKRQVGECDIIFKEQFKDDNETNTGQYSMEIKPMIKQEKMDQDEYLDMKDYGDDDGAHDVINYGNDDDDDDLDDDLPLSKRAKKMVKHEPAMDERITVEYNPSILETILTTDVTPTKIKGTKEKATSSPKKPSTSKEAKGESSQAKRVIKIVRKQEVKKKEKDKEDTARANAKVIIKYSTAYPFRVNDKMLLCVYCRDTFHDPEAFRSHMVEEHTTFNLKIAFDSLPKSEFIKADLTDLKCRICDQKCNNLEEISEHLSSIHGKHINKEGKLGVMAYRLEKGVFKCEVCGKVVASLFHLNRHTITHYLSYVCHFCGQSYVATSGLLRHLRSKHLKHEVECKTCKKVFPSIDASIKHRRTEKSCMPYCCNKCPERFLDSTAKKRHMESAHGETRSKETFSCCGITFQTEKSYYAHFKVNHTNDGRVCKFCGAKFVNATKLKRHMAKHSL